MPNISNCTYELRKTGKVYPRTCEVCGLGPCQFFDRLTGSTDFETAQQIRLKVSELNGLSKEAARRELLVKYTIETDGTLTTLLVNVMTEVA